LRRQKVWFAGSSTFEAILLCIFRELITTARCL
jgi:hypothetical protein